MMRISDNLKAQKAQLIRLAQGMLLGLVVFFVADRGLDAVLMRGLDRYFGLETPDTILLVGHSHVVLGIDRVRLERDLGTPVSKYARAGAQLEDRILMARHYGTLHPDGPRAIVFGVDGHMFSPRGLSSNAHRLFYPHMGDEIVNAYLRDHALSWQEYVTRQVVHLARYNDVLLNVARRGLSGDWSSGVGGRFDPERLAREAELGETRPIAIDPVQVAQFDAFLAEADAKGWPVILTFVPTTEAWNALEPDKFSEVLTLLKGFADTYESVQFLDLRDPWSSQYDLFADPIHLNAKGQRLVTEDLATRLAPLLPEGQ